VRLLAVGQVRWARPQSEWGGTDRILVAQPTTIGPRSPGTARRSLDRGSSERNVTPVKPAIGRISRHDGSLSSYAEQQPRAN
jgi:hypothetical protein